MFITGCPTKHGDIRDWSIYWILPYWNECYPGIMYVYSSSYFTYSDNEMRVAKLYWFARSSYVVEEDYVSNVISIYIFASWLSLHYFTSIIYSCSEIFIDLLLLISNANYIALFILIYSFIQWNIYWFTITDFQC